jgi:tetratricopeptide (TPR) repeat protein
LTFPIKLKRINVLKSLKKTGFIISFALAIILLSGWLIVHNWQHRSIFHEQYAFTAEEAKKFKNFSEAVYAHGLNAWFQNNPDAAANFFRQAILHNIFYMDAWLRLAQTEIALENPDKAKAILKFSDRLTENVYRWKWRQTLLAYELEIGEIVLRNINFLIGHRKMVQDAFQLLDTYFSRDASGMVLALNSNNLIPYLDWLMVWGRVDDTDIAWEKIVESKISDKDIHMKYIDYLVNNKRIHTATNIWRSFGGTEGITNPGFEKEISNRGFDWRYTPGRKNQWTIRRIRSVIVAGEFSLKITFEGKENISFAHLHQIVPVDQLTPYRLAYNWRSRDISTDQGPFIEIYGYDCKGLYKSGPLMLGNNDWQEQAIEFAVPEDCHAIVVRLRRRPSHRFDNKIDGILWLDGFKLEKRKKNRQKNTDLVIN